MITKTLLATAASIVLLSSPVLAQDWTGAFLGLQIGYIDTRSDVDYSEQDGAFRSRSKATFGGSVGGIYGGYNWSSSSPWVYGIEAEYNRANADGSANEVVAFNGTSFPDPDLGTYKTDIKATAALRGRVGYAIGENLFYGTVGIAYADYRVDYRNAGIPAANRSFSPTDTGWTIGAGYERDLGNQWALRVDYRYSDFGTKTLGSTVQPGGTQKYEGKLRTNEFRIGLARRF